MKAVTFDKYCSADGLQISEIDKPQVTDDTLLIRVCTASLNALDVIFMTGIPFAMRMMAGMPKPKNSRLGADFAGVVEKAGRGTTMFREGDEVFGAVPESAGGMPALGTLAEYIVQPEGCIAKKPAGLSFTRAAAIPTAGLTALQLLRDCGKVEPGMRVLIIGASGGVGTFSVQIAKHLGAEVTGVCSSHNVETARAIGCSDVVDYTRDDFTGLGAKFDVVLDNVCNRSLNDVRRVLKPRAVYIMSGGGKDNRLTGSMGRMMRGMMLSNFVSQTLTTKVAKPVRADLELLAQMAESGAITPVIDRTYALAEAKQAMAYMEQGHARGKVVVEME